MKRFDELPDIMKVKDVAEYLDMQPKRVYELIGEGRLIALRVGQRTLRVSKRNLGLLLEQKSA